MKTPTEGESMTSLTVTPLHVERSRQISQIVQHDIVQRGLTFEQSVDSLSEFLGLDRETVMLCIGLVNDLDSEDPHTVVEG
jgi:hypothetical protein